MVLSREQSLGSRGVCVPALEPRGEDEGPQTRSQDFKPDPGNSAVRNYREASRKTQPVTFFAAVTGLRVNELPALEVGERGLPSGRDSPYTCDCLSARRPAENGGIAETRPDGAALSAALLDWRRRCPYNQDSDFVFASAEKHGAQPLWPSSAMSKHIRPAAKLAGITKHVRWHVFRHSFATLLKGNGEDVKTVQESLRHATAKLRWTRTPKG
jgi:integrase